MPHKSEACLSPCQHVLVPYSRSQYIYWAQVCVCTHRHMAIRTHAHSFIPMCVHLLAHTHICVPAVHFLWWTRSLLSLSPLERQCRERSQLQEIRKSGFPCHLCPLLEMSSAMCLAWPFPTGHSCFKIPRQRKLSPAPPLPGHHPRPLIRLLIVGLSITDYIIQAHYFFILSSINIKSQLTFHFFFLNRACTSVGLGECVSRLSEPLESFAKNNFNNTKLG